MEEKFDCNTIIEGREDPLKRMVAKVYYSDKEYAIYNVENSKSLCYITEDVENEISDISFELDETTRILPKEKIQEYKHRFAKAYRDCFEGELENAKKILKSIKESYIEERKNSIYLKYTYIITACFVLIINFIISIWVLDFDLKLTNNVKDLFYVATFGSLGGLISISISLKNYETTLLTNYYLYIIDALFKIIVSMVSAVAVYYLIQGNVVLGFLKDIEFTSEIVFIFSMVSGFSELLIPNLFGLLEEKTAGSANS